LLLCIAIVLCSSSAILSTDKAETLGNTAHSPKPLVKRPLIKRLHVRRALEKRIKHGKVECTTKCMTKVKDNRTKKCIKAYKAGGLLRRCSIHKMKGRCAFACKEGRKFCVTKCKRQFCGKHHIRNCKSVCTRGKKCKKACLWSHHKKCISRRLPGSFVDKCSFITKKKPFRKCLTKCSKHIKVHSCSTKCSNLQIPKEYKNCWNYVTRKARKEEKCSVSGHKDVCSRHCSRGKRVCKRICHKIICGGKRLTVCKRRCRFPTKCHVKCTLKNQMKCLLKKIPAVEATKCKKLFRMKHVRKCLVSCHTKHIVLPLHHK